MDGVALGILAVGLALAFANGANDNFKGVATLHGSGTSRYRGALLWATGTTLAGSLTALLFAQGLLERFQGKGLVPAELVADPGFVLAAALGAAATVLAATRLGLPTSTTHALVGGLVGAGLGFAGAVRPGPLWSGMALPMLASPVAAIGLTALAYPFLRRARLALGVESRTCLCVGSRVVACVPEGSEGGAAAVARATRLLAVELGEAPRCREVYEGRVVGIEARPVLDLAHYLSAGAVSFARGVNDTPKIAALLLVAPAVSSMGALAATASAIALGGLLAARRVADTMSHGITPMNPGQGFTANAVTALLVLGASRFGLPVSTTHVSCGSLFGLGLVRGDARWASITRILLAWVVTLPFAAGIAFAAARIL